MCRWEILMRCRLSMKSVLIVLAAGAGLLTSVMCPEARAQLREDEVLVVFDSRVPDSR